MKFISAVAAALSLGSIAHALSRHYVNSEVYFSLVIPESTANTGRGDLFFQIRAPTSYSWVGLGQGSEMVGSNMFIMYTDSTGKNVTVSPRQAGGHEMPTYNSKARITVLEGSGVKNGIMTANIQCSNCNSWNGGTMDLTASTANFIYGVKTGSPLNSNSMSASIDQHSGYDQFSWPISKAKGGNDANPFLTSTGGSTGGTPTQTGSISATSPPGYASSSTGTLASGGMSDSETTADKMLLAHGVVACIAFVALFPTGGILIRVASFTGLLWVHAALQGFAFLFYIVAFSMGMYIAHANDMMDETHAIIGIALFVALAGQPAFGFMHHKMFKKYGIRTFWSHLHLWHGRIIIPLGLINGYLGIDLAGDASTSLRMIYIAVAAVMLAIYVAAIIYGEAKRWKKSKEQLEPYEKDLQPLSDRQQRRQSFRLQDMNNNQQNMRPVYYARNESVRHQGYHGRDEGTRNQVHFGRDSWPRPQDYHGRDGRRV